MGHSGAVEAEERSLVLLIGFEAKKNSGCNKTCPAEPFNPYGMPTAQLVGQNAGRFAVEG